MNRDAATNDAALQLANKCTEILLPFCADTRLWILADLYGELLAEMAVGRHAKECREFVRRVVFMADHLAHPYEGRGCAKEANEVRALLNEAGTAVRAMAHEYLLGVHLHDLPKRMRASKARDHVRFARALARRARLGEPKVERFS